MPSDRDYSKLLDFLTENAQERETLPFFAPRVATLAFSRKPASIFGTIDYLAKRLLPVMAGLVMFASLFLVQWINPAPGADYVDILFEPEVAELEEQATLEDLLSELGPLYHSEDGID